MPDGAKLARRLRRPTITLVVVYWVLAAIATRWPETRLPRLPQTVPVDKIIHFCLYAGLAWLVGAWATSRPGLPPRPSPRARLGIYAGVLAVLLFYAAIDEWTQPLFGRTCSLGDWLADAAGVIVALALLARVSAKRAPA